eukprot:jgi/Bigna1/81315/fgenesh1_pg.79_\
MGTPTGLRLIRVPVLRPAFKWENPAGDALLATTLVLVLALAVTYYTTTQICVNVRNEQPDPSCQVEELTFSANVLDPHTGTPMSIRFAGDTSLINQRSGYDNVCNDYLDSVHTLVGLFATSITCKYLPIANNFAVLSESTENTTYICEHNIVGEARGETNVDATLIGDNFSIRVLQSSRWGDGEGLPEFFRTLYPSPCNETTDCCFTDPIFDDDGEISFCPSLTSVNTLPSSEFPTPRNDEDSFVEVSCYMNRTDCIENDRRGGSNTYSFMSEISTVPEIEELLEDEEDDDTPQLLGSLSNAQITNPVVFNYIRTWVRRALCTEESSLRFVGPSVVFRPGNADYFSTFRVGSPFTCQSCRNFTWLEVISLTLPLVTAAYAAVIFIMIHLHDYVYNIDPFRVIYSAQANPNEVENKAKTVSLVDRPRSPLHGKVLSQTLLEADTGIGMSTRESRRGILRETGSKV